MKDYSKVKFVKPSVDGLQLKKEKVYRFEFVSNKGGYIYNDRLVHIFVFIPESDHLNGKHFIPCDENGKELGNG